MAHRKHRPTAEHVGRPGAKPVSRESSSCYYQKDSEFFIVAICRNCGSSDILRLENGAHLAPFFAERVFGIKIGTKRSRKLQLSESILFRLTGFSLQRLTALTTASMLCKSCTFLSTFQEIPEDLLTRLYVDYRTSTYNQDREKHEPGYEKTIAPHAGSLLEAEIRNHALNLYFKDLENKGIVTLANSKKILDWGGADGRFLPDFPIATENYVFEVSDCSPVAGVERIEATPNTPIFDYIQIAHVLEHISNPAGFIKKPLANLAPGGILYLEVPMEVDLSCFLEQVETQKFPFYVHEHINKYTPKSLENLALSNGLKVLDVRLDFVELAWTKADIIRLIALKPH